MKNWQCVAVLYDICTCRYASMMILRCINDFGFVGHHNRVHLRRIYRCSYSIRPGVWCYWKHADMRVQMLDNSYFKTKLLTKGISVCSQRFLWSWYALYFLRLGLIVVLLVFQRFQNSFLRSYWYPMGYAFLDLSHLSSPFVSSPLMRKL